MSPRDEPPKVAAKTVLEELRRLARAVAAERRPRRDGTVPAALAVFTRYGEPLPWMRIPGRTIHDRIPSSGAARTTVELDPGARALLERVLTSRLGLLGHSRASFEVWLGAEGEHASVQVGIARVGRLGEVSSRRVLPLIERASARGRKVIAFATLTAARERELPVLEVSVPPV